MNNGQLQGVYGITVYDNEVFVTENTNKRISVFHSNGLFSHIIGKQQLGNPYDVAVSSNCQLLVSDHSHHCIYTFTLGGEFIGKFGTYGTGRGQLCRPSSVATDVNGFILVTDYSHRISIFDKDGKCIH